MRALALGKIPAAKTALDVVRRFIDEDSTLDLACVRDDETARDVARRRLELERRRRQLDDSAYETAARALQAGALKPGQARDMFDMATVAFAAPPPHIVPNDEAYWRATVRALAEFLQRGRRADAESFRDRRCGSCGRVVSANTSVYPASVGFYCSNCQERPTPTIGRSDAWYAFCLLGFDPEASGRAWPQSESRAAKLTEACSAVGLQFGELGEVVDYVVAAPRVSLPTLSQSGGFGRVEVGPLAPDVPVIVHVNGRRCRVTYRPPPDGLS